jgi:hypothetical protein
LITEKSIMKKIIIYLWITFCLIGCSNNKSVKIALDKKAIISGEILTARLYVNNSDSIAPAFYIIKELDTLRLEIDPNDKDCGIYRAMYKTPGEKVVIGYVDFLDKNNKWQLLHFTFKYEVLAIPDNLSGQKK